MKALGTIKMTSKYIMVIAGPATTQPQQDRTFQVAAFMLTVSRSK